MSLIGPDLRAADDGRRSYDKSSKIRAHRHRVAGIPVEVVNETEAKAILTEKARDRVELRLTYIERWYHG